MGEEIFVTASEMRDAMDELNALKQAIVNICDIDTVHAIQARKKVLMKK